MRKAWIYKRKGVKGWWVGWYESGKRKAKTLPTKALAEHFRQIKYVQLDSDVFTGIVTVDWQQMIQEYRHDKQVAGLVESSLYEEALTLRHFERLVGRCSSRQITQHAIDTFIPERGKEVKRSTLNKDISNLRAFLNWCRGNRYVNQYRWTQIRDNLGLLDFKFHDLRKTFSSVLAQKGVSTAVIHRLLEYSSPDLTNKVYTNVDPVLRNAVDQIPADEWL